MSQSQESGPNKAIAWTKEKYGYLTGPTDTFACKKCSSVLVNPNKPLSQASQEQEYVEEVLCPICSNIATIPGSNFSNGFYRGVYATTSTISQLTSKVVGAVTSQRFCNCPTCKTPCKVLDKNALSGAPLELHCENCSSDFTAQCP